MPGKKIEIRIATTADTAGAKKAEESLKGISQENVRVRDTAKEAAAAQRELETERTPDGGGIRDPQKYAETIAAKYEADARQEVAKAKEEERAASQRLREEKRRLTEATREANRVKGQQQRAIVGLNAALSAGVGRMGLWGAALRSLVNPVALVATGIGAVITGLNKWKASLEAHDKAMSDASQAYSENLGKILENASAQREAIRAEEESATAVKLHSQALQEISGSAGQYVAILNQQLDALRKNKEAEQELREARAATEMEAAAGDPAKQAEISNRLRVDSQFADETYLTDEIKRIKDMIGEIYRDGRGPDTQLANREDALRAELADLQEELIRQEQEAGSLRASATAVRAQGMDGKGKVGRTAESDAAKLEERAKAAEKEAAELRALIEGTGGALTETTDARRAGEDQRSTDANALFQTQRKVEAELEQKRKVFEERDKAGKMRVERAREAAEAKRRQEEDKAKADEERERETRDSSGYGLADSAEKATLGLKAGTGKNARPVLTEAQQAKVSEKAKALRDGVAPGEAADLSAVLDQVLNVMEKQGHGRSPKAINLEGIQERLRKLERDTEITKSQLKKR